MADITPAQARKAFLQADCLYNAADVQQALDDMAEAITGALSELDPLVLCVLNGGLITAGHLLTRLNFPLEQDYLHATRYRGATTGATKVEWLHQPATSLQGRHVLLVDDILDEGHTLREIVHWCHTQEPASVQVAVLVEKLHERKADGIYCDFPALQVPDRYVFGYGMDYKKYWRNANGIYAIKE